MRKTVEIATSQANFPRLTLMLGSFDNQAKLASRAGYDGIEAHPFKSRSTIELEQNAINSRKMLTSAHQGYRGERSPLEARHHDKPPLVLLAFLVMQQRETSLQTLARFSRTKGGRLPLVLYPSQSGVELQKTDPTTERTFQPKKEVQKLYEVASPADLMTTAQKRGWSGFCYDIMHSMLVIPRSEINGAVLDYIKRVHVSLGRTDENPNNLPTLKWLQEVLDGDETGEMYPLIRRLTEGEHLPAFVTEISNGALGKTDWTQAHSQIVGHIRRWVSE